MQETISSQWKELSARDCYPLNLMETLPEAGENRQKREVAWNKFISQLKNEKK